MKILALDQATKCGWCLSPELNGTWDLSAKRDESPGYKLLKLRAKLEDIHREHNLDLVVYERVAGLHKSAIIHSAKMSGAIEIFCIDNGIEYRAYSASEVKKFATGKGNANKDKMIEACVEKYNIIPMDDNMADAIHIWHLAASELGEI